jgi:hypothetical protein
MNVTEEILKKKEQYDVLIKNNIMQSILQIAANGTQLLKIDFSLKSEPLRLIILAIPEFQIISLKYGDNYGLAFKHFIDEMKNRIILKKTITKDIKKFLALNFSFIEFCYLKLNYEHNDIFLVEKNTTTNNINFEIKISLLIGQKIIMGEIVKVLADLSIKFSHNFKQTIVVDNITKIVTETGNSSTENKNIDSNLFYNFMNKSFFCKNNIWNNNSFWFLTLLYAKINPVCYLLSQNIINFLYEFERNLSIELYEETTETDFELDLIEWSEKEGTISFLHNGFGRISIDATHDSLYLNWPYLVAASFPAYIENRTDNEILINLIKVTFYLNLEYFVKKYSKVKSYKKVFDKKNMDFVDTGNLVSQEYDKEKTIEVILLEDLSLYQLIDFFIKNDCVLTINYNERFNFMEDIFLKMREKLPLSYPQQINVYKMEYLIFKIGKETAEKLIISNNISTILPINIHYSVFQSFIK